MYGLVIASHFLAGLTILAVLRYKTLKWIRNVDTDYRTNVYIAMIIIYIH